MSLVHATCVDIGGNGVLIRGRPGSGKSDLALRLIDDGDLLVADDQVEITRVGDVLKASPPPPIAGLIEVRGLGLVRMAYTPSIALALVVDLVGADLAGHEQIERMPESEEVAFEGLGLPLLRLDATTPSAAAKVRLALKAGRDGLVKSQ